MNHKHNHLILASLALLGLLFASSGAALGANVQADESALNPARLLASPGTVVDVQVGANMFSFSPQEVTIRVGDTVRWTWVSDVHTVTSGVVSGSIGVPDGKFCSPADQTCTTPIAANTGFIYEHTFTEAGTYHYFCAFHVPNGMTGVVIVNP